MVLKLLTKTLTGIFGSRNDGILKVYSKGVEDVNLLEADVAKLSDGELRAKTEEFRQRCRDGEDAGEMQGEVMAVAREAMDRAVGLRNMFNPEFEFDVNLLSDGLRGQYDQVVKEIESLEPVKVGGSTELVPGWMQVDIPVALYEGVRALYPESKRPFRARPFDVQIIGGMVLGEGKIAEMKTGEGKTIVGPLACYVACVEGMQCHVVTVNDYLVQRDRDWVFPFYYRLGLSVGAIHPGHMQSQEEKVDCYDCDVVYGTNSEFGFDYLRDNMKMSVEEQVQKRRDFCIIDEVDSVLIDEARTPLIISGQAHNDVPRYELADQVAAHLMSEQRDWDRMNERVEKAQMRLKGLEGDIRNSRDKDAIVKFKAEQVALTKDLPLFERERDQFTQYFEVEKERKAAHLTHDGIESAQNCAGIGSFYVGKNMDFPHLLENALRGHAVYSRDVDYVVQGNEVVIVDENTGRLMPGRQWSDGLHQAIECKERVKINEEMQTMATVTIQNYSKLYKRLGGMTGTAITEATEFHEIYGMDVICIPTNVPVIRDDRNDLIYISMKDKWDAILEEIKYAHDGGRPVLVGTTSVEKSELISRMLKSKYGIVHSVLNAKEHERESHIVENAGSLGAIMIATNMAGRGTDIKLREVSREDLINHWKRRDIISRDAKAQMSDEELLNLTCRHMAKVQCGVRGETLKNTSDEELRLMLLRHWVDDHALLDYDTSGMSAEACEKALDDAPPFMLHRLALYTNTVDMGGLHIVGTERHESRRIDNQLRGRSGRQGDQGSSRFYIALEDDLMKMFAGPRVMAILSRLGMKEGDAIEHGMVTRAVAKAQRKVEERNYEMRKSLLEYDEVMEYQRSAFYGIRQNVLEGKGIEEIIFEYIGLSIDDAVTEYLDDDYVSTQIAEWSRQSLDVSIEPFKLKSIDASELKQILLRGGESDIKQTVETTISEYMSIDIPEAEWDCKNLSHWVQSQYGISIAPNKLKAMDVEEARVAIVEAGIESLKQKDMSGIEKFLVEGYAYADLNVWLENKFDFTVPVAEMEGKESSEVADMLIAKARESYQQREIAYPVDFILDLVFQAAEQDKDWAVNQLMFWVKQRYDLDWDAQKVGSMSGQEMEKELLEASDLWLNGGALEKLIDQRLAESEEPEGLAKWVNQRLDGRCDPEEFDGLDQQGKRTLLIVKGRELLRRELNQLERYVLLQILDTAWKEHLYLMDRLKSSVSLMSYAEKDPRIEYKRQGADQFKQMQSLVRDKVTELIFRAKLTASVTVPESDVYADQEAIHAESQSSISQGETNQAQGDEPLNRRERRKKASNKRQTSQRGKRKRR